jgi:hypothetical protein
MYFSKLEDAPLEPVSEHELKSYCSGQIIQIKIYLENKRSEGDERDKQEIVAEWIANCAAEYRDKWYEK